MIKAIVTFLHVGNLRPAPGTWGSAAAIPVAWILHWQLGFPGFAAVTLGVFVVGWWACAKYVADSASKDPSEVVIDEVAGMFVTLLPVSWGLYHAGVAAHVFPWPGWVAGFVLFRLFDILKPGPVGWADRRGDALGVMLDDVIAGVFAGALTVAMAGIYHGFVA